MLPRISYVTYEFLDQVRHAELPNSRRTGDPTLKQHVPRAHTGAARPPPQLQRVHILKLVLSTSITYPYYEQVRKATLGPHTMHRAVYEKQRKFVDNTCRHFYPIARPVRE